MSNNKDSHELAKVYLEYIVGVSHEKHKECVSYDSFGIKMLLLSNGTALVVVCSALDKLLNYISPHDFWCIQFSLYLYLAGMVSGGIIYFFAWDVASGAPGHYSKQLLEIFKGVRNPFDLQGWGIKSNFYRKLFKGFMYLSLICFTSATCILISLLGK